MIIFSYKIYMKDDYSDQEFNTIRKNLGFEGKDAYVIFENETVKYIQWEDAPLNDNNALIQRAKDHIIALEKEHSGSEVL